MVSWRWVESSPPPTLVCRPLSWSFSFSLSSPFNGQCDVQLCCVCVWVCWRVRDRQWALFVVVTLYRLLYSSITTTTTTAAATTVIINIIILMMINNIHIIERSCLASCVLFHSFSLSLLMVDALPWYIRHRHAQSPLQPHHHRRGSPGWHSSNQWYNPDDALSSSCLLVHLLLLSLSFSPIPLAPSFNFWYCCCFWC